MENKNIWIWVIIGALVVLFLFLIGLSALGLMGNRYYGHMMTGSGMFIFGWLFMFLIIIALVVFIIWIIKQMQEPKRKR